MARHDTRFQRAALIAQTARLEHFIDDQLALTIAHYNLAAGNSSQGLLTKLSERWAVLAECRETANKLRQLVWNLD